MEELLRRSVEDILVVRERELRGLSVAFGGELLVSPPRALERLEARFKPFGYTPFLREERDNVWVQAIPLAAVTEAGTPWVNGLLFLATCVSTVWAGAGVLSGFRTFNPFAHPALMTASMVFALTLLLILVTHEFGHYFTARYYHASVSLPYFIPAPPPFIFGTLGAIIKMRSPARDRNSLFDIAVAGPLAGLAIAIPAILVGLSWGRVVAVPPDAHEPMFGDSLLMRFLVYLTFGSIPAGMDVGVHPVGLAGWVGLFVTALNLFPVGQLDGGRIAYALFGIHHRKVSVATFFALLALGVATQSWNWIVWAALLFFLVGFHHSPPLNDVTPLSAGRRVLGVGCLVLLVLLIPPVPIDIR
ncbi:MAG: site-2 protease family protein [Candidatus Rokubacteria bacterium]|nr:site-2 protease family protein [Candidatus Rokubacteria bacterium]MBI2554643.1 site-2 protease family protein [Candidatus Rokubacteria bacterium]